jgi:hypothetical protein
MEKQWTEHVPVDRDDIESLAQEFEREILPLAKKVGVITATATAKEVIERHFKDWPENYVGKHVNQKAAARATLGSLALYIAERKALIAADPSYRHRTRDARAADALMTRMYGELRMLEHKDPPQSERQSLVASVPRGRREGTWTAEQIIAHRDKWLNEHKGDISGWPKALRIDSKLQAKSVREILEEYLARLTPKESSNPEVAKVRDVLKEYRERMATPRRAEE